MNLFSLKRIDSQSFAICPLVLVFLHCSIYSVKGLKLGVLSLSIMLLTICDCTVLPSCSRNSIKIVLNSRSVKLRPSISMLCVTKLYCKLCTWSIAFIDSISPALFCAFLDLYSISNALSTVKTTSEPVMFFKASAFIAEAFCCSGFWLSRPFAYCATLIMVLVSSVCVIIPACEQR